MDAEWDLICSGGVEDAPLQARIAAAFTTSAIGITVANPSDVVKIRMQACTIRGTGTGSGSSHLPCNKIPDLSYNHMRSGDGT